ncbi:MAG: serine hydrolase [Phormidesmis priestleyi]|uniref:Serine hydrolase n=1 Tax=Phormidesmis priestleyi TaxID=268141 RepID=A0A2W4XFV3_9CYAN|nr:MAG: serine hydrolase [Phormidesmis priestleyi]
MPAKFFTANADLQSQLDQILETTWARFSQLAQNQIALTWIVYTPPYRVNTGGALSAEEFWQYSPIGASYRGVESVEPGSLVSLFYLVAAQVWLEQGMIQSSADLDQALADMTVSENPEAVGYVLDVLSGVTSGPTLSPGPFETWQYQRNIVNRYFQQLGWNELRATNLNQKLWSCGPYGREHDFLGKGRENRNLLTSEAIARLMHSIVGGVSVSGQRSQLMMDLLAIAPSVPLLSETTETSQQIKQWRKSAYMPSQIGHISHSAAYIEADSCHPYLLIVLSADKVHHHELEHTSEIVTFISQRIFEASQQLFEADSHGH